MTKKPYVDLAFIVPLPEEFERLTAVFVVTKEQVSGTQFIVHLDFATDELTGVAILQEDMGKAAATRAAETILNVFEVGIVAVIGIAGGLSNDVAVGDVCFSGGIVDVLENAKQSTDKDGRAAQEFNSKFFVTDPLLTFAFKYVQLGSDVKPGFTDWQQRQHLKAKELIPGQFVGRQKKNEEIGTPQIHYGNIACGSVSKSEIYSSNLKQIDRKILAVETESGGVFHACQGHATPAIAIRGICDYADKNKSKLRIAD